MKGLLFLAAGCAATLSAVHDSAKHIPCDNGLHMIIARGTDEPRGMGSMALVAEAAWEAISESSYTALNYPASADYFPSVAKGIVNLKAALEKYHDSCPNGKVALLGYSQGAQVLGDTLCGEFLGLKYNITAPLAPYLAKNVVTIVTFSDPSHVPNLDLDAGTSTRKGRFPRWNTTACAAYADRIRTWCDAGDRYCDSGDDGSVHGSYFDKYKKDAADFIVERYKQGAKSSGKPKDGHTTTRPSSPTAGSVAAIHNSATIHQSNSLPGVIIASIIVLMVAQ